MSSEFLLLSNIKMNLLRQFHLLTHATPQTPAVNPYRWYYRVFHSALDLIVQCCQAQAVLKRYRVSNQLRPVFGTTGLIY